MLLTILLQAVAGEALGKVGIALGAAVAALAAAYGIGRIGSAATESIARQPEAGGSIRSAMIIVAAMIEGASLFAIIVCLLALFVYYFAVMSFVTPDSGLLIWMTIIFGIVFFILAKYGFPVITKMVRERTETINKSLKMAEEARKELADLNKEQNELILQAKKEQAKVIEDATKMKLSIIEQAKVQAQEEAAKILERARLEISAEKESALQDIRKEVAMLSMNVSEKILRSDFTSEEVQKRYVDKVMEELNNRKDSIVKN